MRLCPRHEVVMKKRCSPFLAPAVTTSFHPVTRLPMKQHARASSMPTTPNIGLR